MLQEVRVLFSGAWGNPEWSFRSTMQKQRSAYTSKRVINTSALLICPTTTFHRRLCLFVQGGLLFVPKGQNLIPTNIAVVPEALGV